MRAYAAASGVAACALFGCAPAASVDVDSDPLLEASGVRVDLAGEVGTVSIRADELSLATLGSPLVLTGAVALSQGEHLEVRCERAELDPQSGDVRLETEVRATWNVENAP